ncbi:MAG: 16S rRNA (adenine(1518)-N(6)/adenine(1519)-N(6))-dimethyltransferase RsmA [Candidatus Promineifilaceae bacterium]|nr:16S rRNA (adenine(1518)-N(6)/adenine(1519)-N(6))-dimethyltransferase RsmA [Candidatus Promineifilaceae bacterium]
MEHPKHILDRYGLDPKQSLGQNFLFDDNILSRIVEAAGVTAKDSVLEIGPGVGTLTEHLARAAGRVVAVELDNRFIPILQSIFADHDNVTIVHGDILEQEPMGWFGTESYKVVANVPYYITGAIFRHLLSGGGKPEVMVTTVQKEVAERVTAKPGDMSLLSVSVQLYGEAEMAGTIKAGAFWPRPDVDSAILRVDLRQGSQLSVAEEEAFFRVVRAGFSQKRKQLQKNLRALGFERREVMARLRAAGVEPRRRAETLSVEEWLAVYRALNR